MKKKVVVASKNAVKIDASFAGFRRMFLGADFEMSGESVESGVSHQPKSDQETYLGALNRAKNAKSASPEADFWVGIEGGVEEKNGEMETFAWVVVIDKVGKQGKARSGTFFLPEKVAELVRQGKELGEADDIVFQRHNSKQVNGAIGLLTDDAIDRTSYYTETVVMALVPFKNPELYPS